MLSPVFRYSKILPEERLAIFGLAFNISGFKDLRIGEKDRSRLVFDQKVIVPDAFSVSHFGNARRISQPRLNGR